MINNMNNYIGITIGPIARTLGMAKKPRELWSASYLFSHIMQRLRESIDFSQIELLSPAKEEQIEISGVKVGVYPDRMYIKSGNSPRLEMISETIQCTSQALSKELQIDQTYFDRYFKIYAVEVEAESDSAGIERLNHYLDACELETVVISKDQDISPVLHLIKKKSNSPLFGNEFPVDTLCEIATHELSEIYPNVYKECKSKANEEKDDLIERLKTGFKEELKSSHKYICIVHADGDNVGSLISTLQDGELMKLSSDLMKFGREASHEIYTYGGLPVYAGGDDLLFIAPVVSRKSDKQANIFDLLNDIDRIFRKHISTDGTLKYKTSLQKTKLPTLSYGISISYYKYPLYESLEKSRNNLFGIAKNYPENESKEDKLKNAIAWSVQKNSGSTVSAVFSKTDQEVYKAFLQLVKEIGKTKEEEDRLISAVAHKLRNNIAIFQLFETKSIEMRHTRILSFFKTNLEYKEDKPNPFLIAVMDLLEALFDTGQKSDQVINNAYAMLRTAKFINGLEADHE